MIDAVSSALAGLQVQKARVGAASQNIANATTQDDRYRPVTAKVTAIGGSPRARVVPVGPPSAQVTPSPVTSGNVPGSGPAAGLLTMRDVTADLITLMSARTAYRANLGVLKTADDMQRETLDLLS